MKRIKYIKHPKDSAFAKLHIRENPDDAFENAIKRGMENPEDWMYMYSEHGRDYFKNSCTRAYISYSQFGIIGLLIGKIKNCINERRKLENE